VFFCVPYQRHGQEYINRVPPTLSTRFREIGQPGPRSRLHDRSRPEAVCTSLLNGRSFFCIVQLCNPKIPFFLASFAWRSVARLFIERTLFRCREVLRSGKRGSYFTTTVTKHSRVEQLPVVRLNRRQSLR
jgi:hypothetical protein